MFNWFLLWLVPVCRVLFNVFELFDGSSSCSRLLLLMQFISRDSLELFLFAAKVRKRWPRRGMEGTWLDLGVQMLMDVLDTRELSNPRCKSTLAKNDHHFEIFFRSSCVSMAPEVILRGNENQKNKEYSKTFTMAEDPKASVGEKKHCSTGPF